MHLHTTKLKAGISYWEDSIVRWRQQIFYLTPALSLYYTHHSFIEKVCKDIYKNEIYILCYFSIY